jgi:hypothetical protein
MGMKRAKNMDYNRQTKAAHKNELAEGKLHLDTNKELLFPCRDSKVSNKQHRKDVEKGNIRRKESQKKDRIRWKEMRRNRIFDNKKQNSYFAAIQSITCC